MTRYTSQFLDGVDYNMLLIGCYEIMSESHLGLIHIIWIIAALAQWARAFASQAEGWMFDSKPQETYVVKTGSDSSIA